jgi:hypothetical protein
MYAVGPAVAALAEMTKKNASDNAFILYFPCSVECGDSFI